MAVRVSDESEMVEQVIVCGAFGSQDQDGQNAPAQASLTSKGAECHALFSFGMAAYFLEHSKVAIGKLFTGVACFARGGESLEPGIRGHGQRGRA